MDFNTANEIVIEKLCKNIDNVIEYNKIGIYQGMEGCIEYIQNLTGCDREIAQQIINNRKSLMPSTETPQEYEYRTRKANKEVMESLNKPKCPICNSTNIKKISGLSKAGSVALFGVFAVGKVSKQWKCSNCGSEF